MKTHHIRLIDNTYDSENARDVMYALIDSKIKFLNHQIFSMEERFGSNASQHKKRLVELKQELVSLNHFFAEFDGDDVDVNIGCTVTMNVTANELA